MKKYQEIVNEYQKRRKDTVIDTIATGLTYADEIAVESGLLEEAGLLTDVMENATGILPFAIITISEGSKILLKRKPGKTGLKDGAYRMLKSGAAIGVGSVVMGSAGLAAAIPVTMGVRALFDRYKSRALTGHRVQSRVTRLKELNRMIRNDFNEPETETESIVDVLSVSGSVE